MVIQRWQSLLLLIAAVMAALFCLCSLGQIQGASQTYNISSYGVAIEPNGASVLQTIYVTIVEALAAILSVIAIFMYKSTASQRRVCLIAILLNIAALCSEYLALEGLEIAGSRGVGYSAMAFTPFVAILALIGAWRCIRSDERKLAAADRLR